MKSCKEYIIFNNQLKKYCGVGVRSHFFSQVLAPSWWNVSMEQDRQLTMSMVLAVSKRLGISFKSLWLDTDDVFRFSELQVAYKMRSGDCGKTLSATTAFLANLAYDVLSGIDTQTSLPSDPLEIRTAILRKAAVIDLYSLLDYCWSLGIPVLCVTSHLPKGPHWHHPEALVFQHQGKYCIFLTANWQFQAKYLFPLAHELGHILCKHLQDESCHADDKIEEKMEDVKEMEANEMALRILNGDFAFSPCCYAAPRYIAEWAVNTGKAHDIDPGHLVLRNSYYNNNYANGSNALKIINQNNGNQPLSLIKSKIFKNLKDTNYSDERFENIVKGVSLTLAARE